MVQTGFIVLSQEGGSPQWRGWACGESHPECLNELLLLLHSRKIESSEWHYTPYREGSDVIRGPDLTLTDISMSVSMPGSVTGPGESGTLSGSLELRQTGTPRLKKHATVPPDGWLSTTTRPAGRSNRHLGNPL